MTDLRGRIWRRLFGSKKFLVPAAVAVGAACIASLSGGVWIWVAIIFGLLAIGSVAVELASGAEGLEKKALEELAKIQLAKEEARLSELQNRLRTDRDHRTKDSFGLAKQARADFHFAVTKSNSSFAILQFGKQFDQLFWATIEQLEHSVQLYEQADRLVDARREKILKEREALVEEISLAAERLRQVAEKIRTKSTKERDADIGSLTRELDESLEIAKRVDQRLKELDNGPDRTEFLKQ
ncbi:hypothetical protein SH449x_005333 [Pirellulaceae bacterium SH449]